MADRFRNRYRIKSARLEGYDYSATGRYFVTICTRDRECWFGEIVGGKMQLSEIGKIVVDEWIKTEQIRSNVELDEWGLMPNHFHGIIMITKSMNDDATTMVETPRRGVSTSPQPSRLYPNSLGSIIGQFKSICTKRIRAAGYPQFAWQPRFYDHIIRNAKSLMAIRQYIYNNPAKWEIDRENPESVWY